MGVSVILSILSIIISFAVNKNSNKLSDYYNSLVERNNQFVFGQTELQLNQTIDETKRDVMNISYELIELSKKTEDKVGNLLNNLLNSTLESNINAYGNTCSLYIDDKIDDEMKATRVFPKDVLLNITGASIGRTCIAPETFENGNVNQHVCIIRPSERVDALMLSKIIASQIVQHQIYMSQNGSSREGLNFTQVKNLMLPLPKLIEEQKLIVEHLDNLSEEIVQAVTEIKLQISKLKEYRESLIYEAVTGKIDVRDYVTETEEVN